MVSSRDITRRDALDPFYLRILSYPESNAQCPLVSYVESRDK
jgi:hypothetical protein